MVLEHGKKTDPLQGAFGYFDLDKQRIRQKLQLRALIANMLSEAGIKGFDVFDNTPEACDVTEGGYIMMGVNKAVSSALAQKISTEIKTQNFLFPASVSYQAPTTTY